MMKCISIRQPWAWLIVSKHKDIENRGWPTRFRGPVAVHTGKYVPYEEECAEIEQRFGIKLPGDFDVGGIVGVTKIVDCVTVHQSPWFTGNYGFVLRGSRPVRFIPTPGKVGLFTVPFDLTTN